MGSSPKPGADRLSVPQKRSAPFRLLPRLFSDALPVRRYLPWRRLPAGVMRRSVSFGEEFRRIQRGSSLPFGSAAVRLRAQLAIKLETIYFANDLHAPNSARSLPARCQKRR